MSDTFEAESAYARWPDKGPLVHGRRLTLMTPEPRVRVGQEVRVHHALEITQPGHDLYVMGPKPVAGEYVDGRLQGEPPSPPTDPFAPAEYDGRVAKSPGVDTNFEVTTYRFDTPGVHEITWRVGPWRSNTLTIHVES